MLTAPYYVPRSQVKGISVTTRNRGILARLSRCLGNPLITIYLYLKVKNALSGTLLQLTGHRRLEPIAPPELVGVCLE
jgi:hypothetical protein